MKPTLHFRLSIVISDSNLTLQNMFHVAACVCETSASKVFSLNKLNWWQLLVYALVYALAICVLLSPFFQGPFLLLSAVIYWLRLILIIVNGLLWLAMKVLYLKWHTHVLYAHVRHISIDVYRNMHLCLPAHLCTSLKSHSSFFIFHSSFSGFSPYFSLSKRLHWGSCHSGGSSTNQSCGRQAVP